MYVFLWWLSGWTMINIAALRKSSRLENKHTYDYLNVWPSKLPFRGNFEVADPQNQLLSYIYTYNNCITLSAKWTKEEAKRSRRASSKSWFISIHSIPQAALRITIGYSESSWIPLIFFSFCASLGLSYCNTYLLYHNFVNFSITISTIGIHKNKFCVSKNVLGHIISR